MEQVLPPNGFPHSPDGAVLTLVKVTLCSVREVGPSPKVSAAAIIWPRTGRFFWFSSCKGCDTHTPCRE